ncbi:MAG: hypothetical protein CMM58_01030 [Rhodospirillaceae bacterium]|nr:hypothetical protein [Rhodospirillaceae bacterium]|tara:strand:- start:1727 stop:1936 length:210 start_codon:yes stop_codon:yes gene_type:complete
MNNSEISKVEGYLRTKFENSRLSIEARENKDDSAEVMLDGEFIGVIFKDEDEGEISYDFHMSILEIDLE